MANPSVPRNECTGDSGKDREWEERIYGESCEWARRRAEAYFEEKEEAMYEVRPAGWEVEGFRSRCLVTRFGEVHFKRRLYTDEQGRGRFLLDEYLGLPQKQLATGSVMEAVLTLSGEIGFNKASQQLSKLTAGVLSTATVWRLKERVAQAALATAESEGKAVYARGEQPYEEGEREVERLMVEADGVFVRLQGEVSKHMEIKCGIAYEGWERLGGEREAYRLQNKRVYVHGSGPLSFWEGAGLAWSHHWDWRCVKQIVVGGDGASWIVAGTAWLDRSIWHLDGFHLARASRRALGSEAGKEIFHLIRTGDFVAAHEFWDDTPKSNKKAAQPAIRWLNHLLADKQGQDWRVQSHCDDDTLRGLGAMEGNIAQLIAARMKGKGRSWSRNGALNMAILRQLILNDELDTWCQRRPITASTQNAAKKPKRQRKRDTASWLYAPVPALHGPHPNRPWVRSLRQRIQPHRLN